MPSKLENPFPSQVRSAIVQVILFLGAMAAVFLAGTARQGATGIFFVCAGVAMIIFPPGRIVPTRYWLLCGALILAASLSLLPQSCLPAPVWRLDLLKYQAFPSLPWISLAPRETIYWLVLLAGALAVGLFSLGHPVRSNAKEYIALIGVLAIAGYAALAIHAKTTGWEYPFFDRGGWSPPEFGFFPNRNHTAALLVSGSVLGLGVLYEAWNTRRPFVFLLSAAALALCVYSVLFHSISRGGVVFLVVGVLLWIVALGRSYRSVPLIVSSIVLGGVLIWIFLLSGSQARDRIMEFIGIGQSLKNGPFTGDLRSKIFLDTLPIIRDHPLTGTGLGTFGYVFPFYMDKSIDEAMPIHPESDWLMLAAEAGIPALCFALALLGLLIRDVFRFRFTRSWPLRWGVVSAALVVMLHGFIDVPIHRVELGWWVLVLAGLAFGNTAPILAEKSRIWLLQRLVFGICGAVLLAGGAILIRSQWFHEHPFPPYRGKLMAGEIRALNASGRFDDAVSLGHSEIVLSPMERGLYREIGYSEIVRNGDPRVADAAFSAERALNPKSAKIPYDQGVLWMSIDPDRTAQLWGEALQKHARIEQGGGYANLVEYYCRLLSQARSHPKLFQALGGLASLSPDLRIVWMTASPDVRIEDVLKDSSLMKSFTSAQRRDFLMLWSNRGAKTEWDDFLHANPDWEDAAWPVRIQRMVAQKQFASAIDAVAARYQIDLALPVLPHETLESSEVPENLAARVAYYVAKGNPVTARREIIESIQAKNPEAIRLNCILMLQAGDPAKAWAAMEDYLQATKRSNLP